jgi:Co/Zn/Cd efflux system component
MAEVDAKKEMGLRLPASDQHPGVTNYFDVEDASPSRSSCFDEIEDVSPRRRAMRQLAGILQPPASDEHHGATKHFNEEEDASPPRAGCHDDIEDISPRRRALRQLAGIAPVRQSGAGALSESFMDAPPSSLTMSGNIRVLFLTALLFTSITVAQFVAAKISHSAALMADCISMAADALSYFMNIGVEMREGKRFHRQLQLICPAISVLILVYFTVAEAIEALGTLQEDADGDEPVDPGVVLVFALWGIIFDCFALHAFLSNADGGGTQSNMMSALLHVGADFARSITTLVEALLIIYFKFDGVKTDAWACLLVSGSILLGATALAVEIAKDFRAKGCTSEGPDASRAKATAPTDVREVTGEATNSA